MTTQPIPAGPTVVADSHGNATFTFPVPAQGESWQGLASIPLAPPTARVTATVSGNPVGQWNGATAGQVQADNGQALQLVATGLAPGVQYQAVWVGTVTNERSTPPPLFPHPHVEAISATIERVLIVGPTTPTGTVFTLTTQPGWRSIGISYPAGVGPNPVSTTVDVSGVQSKIDYTNGFVNIKGNSELLVQIDASADQQLTVTFGTALQNVLITASLGDDIVNAAIPLGLQPIGVYTIAGTASTGTVTVNAGVIDNQFTTANTLFILRRWTCLQHGATAPTAGDIRLQAGGVIDVALFSAVPFARDLSSVSQQATIQINNNTNQPLDFCVWYDFVSPPPSIPA